MAKINHNTLHTTNTLNVTATSFNSVEITTWKAYVNSKQFWYAFRVKFTLIFSQRAIIDSGRKPRRTVSDEHPLRTKIGTCKKCKFKNIFDKMGKDSLTRVLIKSIIFQIFVKYDLKPLFNNLLRQWTPKTTINTPVIQSEIDFKSVFLPTSASQI